MVATVAMAMTTGGSWTVQESSQNRNTRVGWSRGMVGCSLRKDSGAVNSQGRKFADLRDWKSFWVCPVDEAGTSLQNASTNLSRLMGPPHANFPTAHTCQVAIVKLMQNKQTEASYFIHSFPITPSVAVVYHPPQGAGASYPLCEVKEKKPHYSDLNCNPSSHNAENISPLE